MIQVFWHFSCHHAATGFNDVKEPAKVLANSRKWVYPKPNEIESIMLESDLGNSYVYSYGSRIFAFSGVKNQIDDFLIPLLKSDSMSRRGIISIWDPLKDDSLEGVAVPGLVIIDFKIRQEKLYISAVVRSNDIFIGWPANLYQLFVLGKYVAEKLNVTIGSIDTFSTSAHIFKDNSEDIKKIVG